MDALYTYNVQKKVRLQLVLFECSNVVSVALQVVVFSAVPVLMNVVVCRGYEPPRVFHTFTVPPISFAAQKPHNNLQTANIQPVYTLNYYLPYYR